MGYFVLVIDETGTPGRMVGPLEWEDAVEKVKEMAKRELKASDEERELSDDEIDAIEIDGIIAFEDMGIGAGGLYIVMPEEH